MARHLPTLATIAVVRLLLAEVPEREAARRTGVARMTVARIGAQLEAGGLAFVLARRTARRIRTIITGGGGAVLGIGREITHEELLLALVRRAARDQIEGLET